MAGVMGAYGTKVIQNGNPNEADVHWGMIVRVSAWIVGIMGACLATLLCAGLLRVFAMSAKIDVIEARQMMVLDELKVVKEAIAAEDYVSRDELAAWAGSETRRESVRALSRDEQSHEAIQREIDRLRAGTKK